MYTSLNWVIIEINVVHVLNCSIGQTSVASPTYGSYTTRDDLQAKKTNGSTVKIHKKISYIDIIVKKSCRFCSDKLAAGSASKFLCILLYASNVFVLQFTLFLYCTVILLQRIN